MALGVVAFILLTVLLLLAVAVVAVVLRPRLLIVSIMRYYQWKCGMAIKYIGTEDFVYCYGEKGKPNPNKSSILFVHGFTASKDAWISLFRRLPPDLHLVAVDLPGHGATSQTRPEEKISLEGLAKRVHQFVELVGLDKKPFHIVGSSLGGTVVGVYAAMYPHMVERVSMTCPAMRCPESSFFAEEVEANIERGVESMEMHHCSLLPQTPEEVQRMFNLNSINKPELHGMILKSVVDLREPKNEYFLKIFKDVAAEENLDKMQEIAPTITPPSQIIWGDSDEIVHMSGAEVLRAKLPNCERVDIIDKCGHGVDMDRPGAFAKALLQFRNEYEGRKKDE